MADSLDDFFAKKDKKRKNKSQAVAFSAEALVRELEVGSKQNEYSSRRDGKSSTALELLGLDANDNDWKDFEEVERRDYTGLKVKEMSIQDQEEELRRFNEQVEQAPELIPWKSKEETVAAIISSKDLNQFPHELLKNDEETGVDREGPASKEAPKATASGEGSDNKTEIDPSKAVSSSKSTQNLEQPSDGKPTPATDTTAGQGTPTPSGSQADGPPATTAAAAPKKDGDSGSSSVKPSAKYVPPHERVNSDVKVLEPVKLIKLTGPRFKASNQKIDIKDEKSFPSLG